METGLKGKVVIVTGGSSTIGRATVLAFAKEGAKVVIADWDEPQGKKTAKTAKELGAEGTLVVKTDVTHYDEVDNMVKKVLKKFGPIDVLVNDVGRPSFKTFPEETIEQIDDEIETNLVSTINCTKAILPHMIQAGTGSIINLGSEAGRMGDPERMVYSACKGGVIAITKSLARSVGSQGIRVNCVCPNTIMPTGAEEIGERSIFHPEKGQFSDAGNNPEKYIELIGKSIANHCIARLGMPTDIAPAIVFLASEGASYITGQILSINGGSTMP